MFLYRTNHHNLDEPVFLALHCLFQSLELLFQSWSWMTHLSRRMTLQKLLKMSLKRFLSHICNLFTCVEFALEHVESFYRPGLFLMQAMSAYGYQIVQTLIVDIEPDDHVKRAMNEINAGKCFTIHISIRINWQYSMLGNKHL